MGVDSGGTPGGWEGSPTQPSTAELQAFSYYLSQRAARLGSCSHAATQTNLAMESASPSSVDNAAVGGAAAMSQCTGCAGTRANDGALPTQPLSLDSGAPLRPTNT